MDRALMLLIIGILIGLGLFIGLHLLMYFNTYSIELKAFFDFFAMAGLFLFFFSGFFYLLYKTKIQ